MHSIETVAAKVLLAGPATTMTRASAILRNQSWQAAEVQTPNEALRYIRNDPAVDLVLVTPGEDLDPWLELCRNIKFDRRTSFVSVICLALPEHSEKVAEILQAGADDCVRSIASDSEISLRLLRAVRMKRATDTLEDAEAVIKALAGAVEGKDEYTCGHVERVSLYSVEIGKRAGVDAEGLAALQTGGVVHDIGKIGIPDHILNKPGKLTDEEMLIMQRHPLIGYGILEPLRTFRTVLPIVRWHHEKLNGSGYPDGLKGDEVPLLPRITAVADCFDALSTERPYRGALSMAECKGILEADGEKGNLDARLVKILFEILDARMIVATPAAA
jgi:putative two-component system response regulator